MMDPQQEIFTKLKIAIEDMGYRTFDSFIPEDAAYPFVYLGDSQQVDQNTKGLLIGKIYQTVHVYSNDPGKRGSLSQIMGDIKKAARLIKLDDITVMLCDMDQQIIPDNTTSEPLMHGIISLGYKFS